MKGLVKIILLFAIPIILSACIFDDEEEKWDADKVCPETGTNAYGMPNRGTFTDERDGQVYKYTTIGKQVWMAENLRYRLPYPYSYAPGEDYSYVDEQKKDTVYRRDTTGLGEIGKKMQSKCTDADCIAAEFVATFGRYYSLIVNGDGHGPLDWDIVDSVCPKGWHVPTRTEWEILFVQADGNTERLMKVVPWRITATDECGTSFIQGGSAHPPQISYHDNIFVSSSYWSSTQFNSEYVCIVEPNLFRVMEDVNLYKMPIRCIKD